MQYQSNSRHTHLLIALGIFGIALLLRLPTVWHALPYIPYSDETYVMDRIFYAIRASDPLLSDFLRPHFSINLFALAVRIDVWLRQIDPTTLPESTFRVTTLVSPFVAARLLNICFGALTAVAVFLWARLILPLPLAIIAGTIMSLIPFNIEYSGLLTPDVLAAMCATFFFGFATRYAQRSTTSALIGMMICVGCATGAKYNFISLALVMSWLIWRTYHTTLWRAIQVLVGAWVTIIVVFVITSPSIIFNFNDFVTGFININRLYYTASDTDPTRFRHFPADTYATWLGSVVIPTSVAVSAVWGVIRVLRYRQPVLLASIGVALLNLLFFFAQSAHAPRNFIFVEPIAVVVGLYGFTTLYKLPNIWHRRPEWALSLIVLVITAWSGIQAAFFFARPYNPNVVDSYLQRASRGAPSLAHVEAVLYNKQPWIIPLTTEDVALFQTWQEAGADIIAINRKYWPDLTLRSADVLTQLGASDNGGSGWPFDIYKNHLLHNLRTVGTPLPGSDGVDFIGIRVGRGALRPQLTPLDATTSVTSDAEALQVNVYLHVNATPKNVTPLLFVHVIDANGNKVGERNTVPVDYYAMEAWQPGDVIVANADVPTGALAPGTYQAVIGFYIVEQGQIVPFASPDGTARIDLSVTP